MKNLLLSYPKSGRTWLRILLDKLNATYNFHHGRLKPRFAKLRTVDYSCLENKRVLYLYRDPLDTLLSEYYASKYASNAGWFNGTRKEYAKNELHLNWILNHHKSIVDAPNDLLIRSVSYEKLKTDGHATLKSICDYFQIEVDQDELEEAYDSSVVEKLQDLHKNSKAKKQYLLGSDQGLGRKNLKIRKGIIGEARREFDQEEIEMLDERLANFDYSEILSKLRLLNI